MNRLSVSGQKADQSLDRDPSDLIKHSLETSKHGSFRLTLNVLIVQLSKLIVESIIQNFQDCVQFLI